MFNRFGASGPPPRQPAPGGYQNTPPPQGDPRQQAPGYQNYSRPQANTPQYDPRMGGAPDDGAYNSLAARPPVGGRGPAPLGQNRPQRNSGGRVIQLQPVKSHKGNEYAFANWASVSPVDFGNEPEIYLLLNGKFAVTAKPIQLCPPGEIGLSDKQRSWAGIGIGPQNVVNVERYDPFTQGESAYMHALDVECGFALTRKTTEKPYDQEMLNEIFCHTFENQVLAPGQLLLMDVGNIPLELSLSNIELVDLSNEKGAARPPRDDPEARGIVTKRTQVTFYKSPGSTIKLKSSIKKPAANSIIAPNFKFEELGIGGLDNEFETIFRKAFASRLLPLGLMEQLGIVHVKGLLLYGPPGTGKTLIARQIGKMLNSREPKIINGPEVLNKFVGQSEENIRKLFADAEKEYKEKGDDSELHVIIFDELDAVCKQRGSGAGGGTGVGDSVVNQLLSKLDGVDALNNILLIGMTNRKDMIDEALLRPGRLEVHLEIGLPDESGRVDILNIHTSKMKQNGRLDADVNLAQLAKMTKNFSGAEIAGLVRAATSWAQTRHIKVGTMASLTDDVGEIRVKMEDFTKALDAKEIVPLFGVAEEELEEALRGGFFPYSETVRRILKEGSESALAVKDGDLKLLSTLFHGPPGSGKTGIAAKLAMSTDFPFIKFVTPNNLIGMGESAKVAYLDKVFRDADKSPTSLIVIDEIESLIDWVPIGPRFSNSVLQALKTLIKKPPPKDRRRLIFCTTSERQTLSDLGILSAFTMEFAVPHVLTGEELSNVLAKTGAFDDRAVQEIPRWLQQTTGSQKIGVGVKDVLEAIARSKKSGNMMERFVEIMAEQVAMNN